MVVLVGASSLSSSCAIPGLIWGGKEKGRNRTGITDGGKERAVVLSGGGSDAEDRQQMQGWWRIKKLSQNETQVEMRYAGKKL